MLFIVLLWYAAAHSFWNHGNCCSRRSLGVWFKLYKQTCFFLYFLSFWCWVFFFAFTLQLSIFYTLQKVKFFKKFSLYLPIITEAGTIEVIGEMSNWRDPAESFREAEWSTDKLNQPQVGGRPVRSKQWRATIKAAGKRSRRFLWYSFNVILNGYANLGVNAIAKME